MDWEFLLPVRLIFGSGKRRELASCIDDIGGSSGVLVCSATLEKSGAARELVESSAGRIKAVFSDIRPNPTTDNVNACAELLRKTRADFAVALGGGSPMDCCKAACAIARADSKIEEYHTGGRPVRACETIPMIAMPTTSGTASEVTNIAVLTDTAKNLKAPMNDPAMYPKIALIDPELTLSVPARVTASTGLDVLSHAVESYWSTLNQPICSACAVYSAKLVFKYLERACSEPSNLEAREKMAAASITAGVAFSHPRTTGSHACSFPLTNIYGVPHGEACAFTLDYFIRFNAERADSSGRLAALARQCGFKDAYDMANAVYELKRRLKMRTRLCEIGCSGSEEELRRLTEASMSMLMTRNPVPLTEKDIFEMYSSLK